MPSHVESIYKIFAGLKPLSVTFPAITMKEKVISPNKTTTNVVTFWHSEIDFFRIMKRPNKKESGIDQTKTESNEAGHNGRQSIRSAQKGPEIMSFIPFLQDNRILRKSLPKF